MNEKGVWVKNAQCAVWGSILSFLMQESINFRGVLRKVITFLCLFMIFLNL